jgi:hypothetical protein
MENQNQKLASNLYKILDLACMLKLKTTNYNIHGVKNLKGKDLIKVIKEYRFIIINTNK